MGRKERRAITNGWDLSDPKDAREFLRRLRVGEKGARIEFLQEKDGKRLSLDEASDEQILQTVRDSFGLKGTDQ